MSDMPARRPLLRETAYDTLRNAVVRGDVAPGEPVRDAELAQRLGLSRAPVRDALARLGHEGLVETRPQSYTRVTSIVPREVREAATVVRVLQQLAARGAAGALGTEDIEAMREAHKRFTAAAGRGAAEAALEADDELFGVLLDVFANHAATATVERCTPLIRRLQLLRPSSATTPGPRDELISACAASDGEASARCIADLWRDVEEVPDDLRFL